MDALKIISDITDKLTEGVFLNVKGNTMTIAWGGLIYMWNKPVFVAVVRPQRFTYDILVREREFTVSIPLGDMRKALNLAGTLSGADGDKFERIGLTPAKAKRVGAPIIAECDIHLECRVRALSEFIPESVDKQIIDYTYQARDYHTMFFGEVVDIYETKK